MRGPRGRAEVENSCWSEAATADSVAPAPSVADMAESGAPYMTWPTLMSSKTWVSTESAPDHQPGHCRQDLPWNAPTCG